MRGLRRSCYLKAGLELCANSVLPWNGRGYRKYGIFTWKLNLPHFMRNPYIKEICTIIWIWRKAHDIIIKISSYAPGNSLITFNENGRYFSLFIGMRTSFRFQSLHILKYPYRQYSNSYTYSTFKGLSFDHREDHPIPARILSLQGRWYSAGKDGCLGV